MFSHTFDGLCSIELPIYTGPALSPLISLDFMISYSKVSKSG